MSRLRHIPAVPALVAITLLVTAAVVPAAEANRTRLSNGVTVITQSSSWNRIFALAIVVGAGSKYDPPELGGLADLTSRLLAEGTAGHSAMELAELADAHGIVMDTFVTADLAGFHMACIDENADVAVELAAEMLTRPAFDEERLLRTQGDMLEGIARAHEDARSRNHDELFELMFADHPYSRPVHGTMNTVENITAGHVRKFYKSRYAADNTVISVVGSFSEDEVIDALDDLLSGYEGSSAKWTEPGDVQRAVGGFSETYMDVSESRLSVGYLAPPPSRKDYAALRVVAALMGGGRYSRIQRALGAEGAGASCDAMAYVSPAEDASALIVDCGTMDVEAAVDIIEEEAERLRSEPASDEEIGVARNVVKGTVVIRSQTNLARALRLATDYVLTGSVDALDTFVEQVNRVSRDDVLRVAREYLVDPVVAVVRPGRAADHEKRAVARGI